MQLQISYIPQVPGKPFTKAVKDLAEAKIVADTLTEFSNFEYENNIKHDYSDALDLEMFEDGEWVTWYDDEGRDFSEWMNDETQQA